MKDLAEDLALLFERMNALETRVRTFDELERRIRDFDALEQRVRALENFSGPAFSAPTFSAPTFSAPAPPEPAPVIDSAAPLISAELPSGEQVSSVFLVLGKALLGIAGAYVLRALEESAFLPRLIVAALAIVYAIAWLVAASRTGSQQRFAAVLYSGASALILAPMLWELTMRFHVLSPITAAAVLGLYAAVAVLQSWRRKGSPACSVATAAAAFTALALSIVTHVMLPFLILLLAMVAVSELHTATTFRAPSLRQAFGRKGGSAQPSITPDIKSTPSQEHSNGARILIAAVADCAVWILLYLYRMPPGARTDYPALSTPVLIAVPALLFVITATGVGYRTVILGRRVTAFESTQAVIAFLLAACSPLLIIPNSSPRIVGAVCIVFASACNVAAFRIFRRAAQPRNFRVFTGWGAALTLAGAFLTLSQSWAASALALAAVLSILVATRLNSITLQAHAAIYLAVSASTSGLPTYAFQCLAGLTPSTVSPAMLLVSACASLAYALTPERDGETWQSQLLHLLPAALATIAVSALITHASLSLSALLLTPDIAPVAFLRTLVLCGIALTLAFAGARWHRPQMRRIAYTVLAFVAVKLVFEDLRHGHMAFIAASIFLFALTLIAVPRLARSR